MKIVCNNCNAKYSIADEKVKGKVFKIRCKKCGDSIVVRGDSPPEQTSEPAPPPMPLGSPEEGEGDAETRVFDYSGYRANAPSDSIWYIVVEGEQQGPFSAEQLSGFLEGNSLDAESFVWKEGFDDWLPIREVPELADALGIAAAGASPDRPGAQGDPTPVATGGIFDIGPESSARPEPTGKAFDSPFEPDAGIFNKSLDPDNSAADVFSSAPSSPADSGGLFTDNNHGGAEPGALFSASPGDPTGDVDLFADGADNLGSNDIFGADEPTSNPRVSAHQATMTGQRNENSVLFSLSNLQALASETQNAPSPLGGGPDPIITSTGGSEGSGLIDIRSLASSLKAESDNTATGEEDFLSMGGGGFAPALGAPVLAPSREGPSKAFIIGLVTGGVILLAGIVVLALAFLAGPSDDEQREKEIAALKSELDKLHQQGSEVDSQQMAALQKQLEKKQEEKTKAQNSSEAQVAGAGAGDKEDAAEDEDDEVDEDERKRRSRGSSRSASSSRRSSSSKAHASSPSKSSQSSSSSSSPASSGSSSKTEPSGGRKVAHSELDDLLGSGGGSKATKPEKETKSQSPSNDASKATLSRSDVQQGMNGVAGKVKACGGGETGTVTLKVVISKTGSVISASPTGSHTGTSVGNCAARAVRAARFPKSSQNLTVRYPFRL